MLHSVGSWCQGSRLGVNNSCCTRLATVLRACVASSTVAVRVLAAIALAAPQHALARSDQTDYLISDFEGPHSLENWRFESDPPAPDGGLTLGPGRHHQGAILAYRLSCHQDGTCDDYAAALWHPASPLPKKHDPAISLWIRFSRDVQISLVVKDTSGRTTRFPIRPSIEHPKPGGWQYLVVPLGAKYVDANQQGAASVRGRLIEVGIVVHPRFQSIVQGAVSFDDLRLQALPEIFFIEAANGSPQRESAGLVSRLGVNIHLLRDDKSLDAAHAAGFEFVRADLLWENVERRGRYRFFPYDALLRALDARGMGVLWILDYGHPDHGGEVPQTPEDIGAFGRFAEAVAEHFKGRDVRYEIWNEPNTAHFWRPGPSPMEYARLLRESVAAIHRADPSAKVSSGGVSGFDAEFLSEAMNPALAAGLAAIGVHPYPKAGPETIAPSLEMLTEWAAHSLGDGIQIWDTEWGYSSANWPQDAPSNGHTEGGRKRQAELAVRELLTVWALGLPVAVWYDLRDDGQDGANPEHNYGLLDFNANDKPAMQAIRNLMTLTRGRKYGGMIEGAPPGIHAMRWNGPTDTVLIVWTDQPDGRRKIEFSKSGLLSATDLFGNPIQSKDGRDGRARLELEEDGGGPVYLLWNTASRGAPSSSVTP